MTMEEQKMEEQQSLFEMDEMKEAESRVEGEKRLGENVGASTKAEASFNGERMPQLDVDLVAAAELGKEIAEKKQIKDGVKESDPELQWIELPDGRKFTPEEWTSPVFDDGPTREMVESWKQEHRKIYMVPFDFGTFIIRGLTRPEYRSIQEEKAKLTETGKQEPLEERLAKKFDNEELISAICTIWPPEAQNEEFFMEKVPAGTAGILAEMIYDKSAFRALTPPIAL
ncbi:hypothetical protein C0431_13280 [bacterium]|nr:hypothetical protein [bacterium]